MTTGAASLVPPPRALSNRLLAMLSPEEYRRIAPDLTTVEVKLGQALHFHDERIREVYFPQQGVYSMITTMANGQMVEIASVGNEGMLGLSAYLGDALTPNETMLQVGEGVVIKMGLGAFNREIERGSTLYRVVGRYVQVLVAGMMQSIACNRLHHVRERCSRWLLETHDRIHADEFKLSHEFLAIMLGSHRPTVTVVAGALQKAGLIRYRHGRITIVDRAGLEKASCECYGTVRRYFDRLETSIDSTGPCNSQLDRR
jgi:CRP-like cAMP-binding protein